jgi:hexosaminidase
VELDPIVAIVPAPMLASPGDGVFVLGPGTTVTGDDSAAAVAQHLASEFGLELSPTAGTIRLVLGGDHGELGDEGYELTVTPDRVTLVSCTAVGLFRGVQTLRQLRSAAGTIPAGRIIDRPRFAYRGVMLDVARHFFPVSAVKRLIDLAALLKLNHLHLHLTDDQGWRIAIDQWPRLTEYGGGTEVGDGPGGYYTKTDYREIVAYAADRSSSSCPKWTCPDTPTRPWRAIRSSAPTEWHRTATRASRSGFSSLAVPRT